MEKDPRFSITYEDLDKTTLSMDSDVLELEGVVEYCRSVRCPGDVSDEDRPC